MVRYSLFAVILYPFLWITVNGCGNVGVSLFNFLYFTSTLSPIFIAIFVERCLLSI